jgi:hypothetical protein
MKNLLILIVALTAASAFAQSRTVCKRDYLDRIVCDTQADPYQVPRQSWEPQRTTCKKDYLDRIVCDTN